MTDRQIDSFFKAPPSDAPVVDTAEQVYISSLALLKVMFSVDKNVVVVVY